MSELGVSVVIAAFRAEATLGAAIQSVLAQTSPVDQIIVVDDGSDDSTANVAQQFGGLVIVHRLPHNQGVAAALNHGLTFVTQPVLAFIDADDLWPVNRVAEQRQVLADPEVDVVDGWSVQFNDPDSIVAHPDQIKAPGPPQPAPGKATMAIRRTAFERVGDFDPAFRHGDVLEWLSRPEVRTLRRVTLPTVLHFRRIHGDNMGVRARDLQRAEYASVMRDMSRRRREQRG